MDSRTIPAINCPTEVTTKNANWLAHQPQKTVRKRPGSRAIPFPSSYRRRPEIWKNVSRRDWNDWRWQMRQAVRSASELRKFLSLSDLQAAEIATVEDIYRMVITPHFLSLVDPMNPRDPIWLQAVPTLEEVTARQDLEEDPLAEEAQSPVPGLIHRYPDRALIVATDLCPVYCRHCFRKRLFRADASAEINPHFGQALDYLQGATEVREVILSGGDPLMLSDARLEYLLSEIRAMKHIELIRIHTRAPVTLPQRLFASNLRRILRRYSPIWMVTHFNHPNELTAESARAIDLTLRAGIPVNNQSVLLKGVNDDIETIKELVRGLLRMKCRPYYLHHCDPIRGAGHFRTSVAKGLEIMEALRGQVSGLAIPTYVVDSPGGFGKIPIAPNYIVSMEADALILKTPGGHLIRYPDSTSDLAGL